MLLLLLLLFLINYFTRTFLVSLLMIVNLLDIHVVSMGTPTKKLAIAGAQILFDKVYKILLPIFAMAGRYLPAPSIQ